MLVRGITLAIVLALLPAASAVTVGVDNPEGPAATTLYMHIADELNDFPLSTDPPQGLAGPDGGQASTTHSLCLQAAEAATTLASKQFHTYYGYTTPDGIPDGAADALSQFPHGRGLAADFALAPGSGTLHFFLASNAGTATPAPTFVPNVIVEATVRTGSAISVDDSAYNEGTILMTGRSEAAVLAGTATTGATFESVGGRDVYGFEVPLAVQATNVTARDGLNVRVDVYVENPVCASNGGRFMPDLLVPFLDDSHLSRLDLATLRPLRILSVSPSFLQHGVAINIRALSPWGAYDVDAGSAKATIRGPDEAPTLFLAEVSQAGGTAPLQFTFFWPNVEDEARGGLYAVEVQVANLQGTATANATAAFDLQDGTIYPALDGEAFLEVQGRAGQEASGPAFVLVLAAISMALARRSSKP